VFASRPLQAIIGPEESLLEIFPNIAFHIILVTCSESDNRERYHSVNPNTSHYFTLHVNHQAMLGPSSNEPKMRALVRKLRHINRSPRDRLPKLLIPMSVNSG